MHRRLRRHGRCAVKAEEIVDVMAALASGVEYGDAAPAHRPEG